MSFIDLLDGIVKTDIYSDKSIKAIDWARKIVNNYSDSLIWDNYDWTRCWDYFVKGDTVMTLTATTLVIDRIAKEMNDFGVVPFPCGPDTEYGRWSADVLAAPGMSIFATAKEPEYAAHIINRLFEPFEGLKTKQDLIDYSMRSTFFDQRDANLMMEMINYARYNYWTVGGDDFWLSAAGAIKKSTGIEIVQKFGNKIETVVEKYISKNYDYMSAHSNEK